MKGRLNWLSLAWFARPLRTLENTLSRAFYSTSLETKSRQEPKALPSVSVLP